MRQVDHAHDAEDQRQASGQHEQQQPVLDAVEQLDQEINKVHRVRAKKGKSQAKVLVKTAEHVRRCLV